MRNIILLLLFFLCQLTFSANIAITPIGSVNIGSIQLSQSNPAIIDMVPGSIHFSDLTGNNAIDAGERCFLRFAIKNSGKGVATDCKVVVSMSGVVKGLTVYGKDLPQIKPGETQNVEIPIVADMTTQNGKVDLSFKVVEPNGFGTDEQILGVVTKAFEPPFVKVTDYVVTGNTSGVLQKKQPFDIQLLIQNVQHGTADDVAVSIELPANITKIGIEGNERIGTLKGGQAGQIVYSLIANNNYSRSDIPIKIHVFEKYGKYKEDTVVYLKLNQHLSSTRIDVKNVEEKHVEIEELSLTSKVDKNIPKSEISNENTFVVIFANENYDNVDPVPFAINDGDVFRKYCLNTLGIPKENVHYVSNATLGKMKTEVKWLKQIIDIYKESAKILLYYAGHGVPDESSRTSYLLPVDGDGSDMTSGYKLDDLYNDLGDSRAKSVIVFLDACFSGAKRDGNMLVSARGVAIKAKVGVPQGNMVVLSAASNDETANKYENERHGLFTYYVLDKLQQTNGNATLLELGDYVMHKVSEMSIRVNAKRQTPTLQVALGVNGWEKWTFK